jgi:pimeloyl-ACP methyl ester carboxylesterase
VVLKLKQNNLEIIYAIPGLGTTKELFQNIAVPNHEIKVLNWPPLNENYSLKEYAACFISQIDVAKPVNLMGVSFGGMLCSELAELLETKKVILISSCKDVSEFPLLLKTAKSLPVYKLFSEKVCIALVKDSWRFLGFEKSFESTFFKMIDRMPENYFLYAVNYILNWNKTASKKSFIRIHGTADKLLTYYHKSFHLIQGGSHAMIVNRADEINAILNKELNGL